jgi:hypothetical protein
MGKPSVFMEISRKLANDKRGIVFLETFSELP